MPQPGSKNPFGDSLAERYVKTASKPIRLLLVEDNSVQRELLRFSLSEFNVEIDEAQDRSEAVGWAEHGGHDIALVDMRIPTASDGVAVIAHLRKTKPLLPICVYSGALSGEIINEAVEAGGVITFAPKMFVDAHYLEQLFAMFNLSARAGKDRSR